MKSWTDTIAAPATAEGTGAIAVIRMAGPAALAAADRLYRGTAPPPSARAGGTFAIGRVVDPLGREIDDALFLIFKAPRSYTGEDQVEIQFHGGRSLREQVMRAVLESGCRMAEPGEFTKRAFLNGKMDLIQAEAVSDLVRAESDKASHLALEQLHGRLSRTFGSIYDDVVSLAADLESTLDFTEDELPPVVFSDLERRIRENRLKIETLLDTWNEGRLIREGVRLVILGRPNAGKSTLFNALLRSDRAIVSHHPGTTRDIIEENCRIGGYVVRLFDTAGLRESSCEIEKEGIRRTVSLLDSDVYGIYVVDASDHNIEIDKNILSKRDRTKTIIAINKNDLSNFTIISAFSGFKCVFVSASMGTGIESLKNGILELMEASQGLRGEGVDMAISNRHRDLLERCRARLAESEGLLRADQIEQSAQVADMLRQVAETLGEATGRKYHDDLLQQVFSKFCIGK